MANWRTQKLASDAAGGMPKINFENFHKKTSDWLPYTFLCAFKTLKKLLRFHFITGNMQIFADFRCCGGFAPDAALDLPVVVPS